MVVDTLPEMQRMQAALQRHLFRDKQLWETLYTIISVTGSIQRCKLYSMTRHEQRFTSVNQDGLFSNHFQTVLKYIQTIFLRTQGFHSVAGSLVQFGNHFDTYQLNQTLTSKVPTESYSIKTIFSFSNSNSIHFAVPNQSQFEFRD